MKIFLLIALFSANVAANDFTPITNVTTIYNPPKTGEVFVPPGFDDLDDSEITFMNHSKNSCFLKTYSLPPQIDAENKIIRISNFSMVLDGDYCISRDISSPTTLKVGELPAGKYKVEFETEKGQFASYSEINVGKSKSEQKDDFQYAPLDINELTVKVDAANKNIELTLPGSFPNGCYKFKEVKVLDTRSETVIEVLPIVEMMTTICTQEIQFFSKKVIIPYKINGPMKKLIHIRSADGVAINRIVNLE